MVHRTRKGYNTQKIIRLFDFVWIALLDCIFWVFVQHKVSVRKVLTHTRSIQCIEIFALTIIFEKFWCLILRINISAHLEIDIQNI